MRLIISFPSRATFLLTQTLCFLFSTLESDEHTEEEGGIYFYECVCVCVYLNVTPRHNGKSWRIVSIAVVLSDVVSSGIINVRMGTGEFLDATPAFTMCFFFFFFFLFRLPGCVGQERK
jgi:urea transporter